MDMEDGIPAFIPVVAPTPPMAPAPIPGMVWPMGAIPARGTMVMGCAGMELRLMGSGMLPKPAGMGLIRIWLRVGGAGWLTWKGLAWAAGAEPPAGRRDEGEIKIKENKRYRAERKRCVAAEVQKSEINFLTHRPRWLVDKTNPPAKYSF